MLALIEMAAIQDLRFLTSSLLIILAPGPGVFFVLGAGVSKGLSHGVAAAVGVSFGVTPHLAAATLGLAALVEANPLLFQVVRLVGGGYLIYLGVALLRDLFSGETQASTGLFGSLRSTIIVGALITLASPQLTFFFVSYFPSFIDPNQADGGLAMTALGATFMSLALIVLTALGVAAALAGRRAFRSAGFMRAMNLLASIAFLFIGVDVLTDGELRFGAP